MSVFRTSATPGHEREVARSLDERYGIAITALRSIALAQAGFDRVVDQHVRLAKDALTRIGEPL